MGRKVRTSLGQIDLRRVEGQARQRDSAALYVEVASPALLFQAPTFLQFAKLAVLDMPTRTKRLEGGHASNPVPGRYQCPREIILAGWLDGPNQAAPQR